MFLSLCFKEPLLHDHQLPPPATTFFSRKEEVDMEAIHACVWEAHVEYFDVRDAYFARLVSKAWHTLWDKLFAKLAKERIKRALRGWEPGIFSASPKPPIAIRGVWLVVLLTDGVSVVGDRLHTVSSVLFPHLCTSCGETIAAFTKDGTGMARRFFIHDNLILDHWKVVLEIGSSSLPLDACDAMAAHYDLEDGELFIPNPFLFFQRIFTLRARHAQGSRARYLMQRGWQCGGKGQKVNS